MEMEMDGKYNNNNNKNRLNVIRKKLVELGNLSGNREIDGAVTDFDNETTKNFRVDLV